MASNIAKKRLLILGGNGYVGSNICHAAIQSGNYLVRSLNRSGAPVLPSTSSTTSSTSSSASSAYPTDITASLSQVEWIQGDIFHASTRSSAMEEVDTVISCIGAFGSNEFMQRICGDATIEAIRTAKERGIEKFGFISSAQVYEGSAGLKIPSTMPMHGYFQGKYRAEQELKSLFPEGYVIARPGFIYGPRAVGPLGVVPLQYVGGPMSFVGTGLGPVSGLIQSIPFVGKECSSMVPVESLGRAMVESIGGESGEGKGGIILEAEDIRKF